jgi:hypothetical protein
MVVGGLAVGLGGKSKWPLNGRVGVTLVGVRCGLGI